MARLVYFGIRARADNIRYALALKRVKYEDIRPEVKFEGRDNETGTPLFTGKYKTIAPFGNLPYWEDENVLIAQTSAILTHIGRSYDLYGANNTQRAYIDQLVCVGEEIVNSFFPMVRFPTFEEKLPMLLHGQRGILSRLEQLQKLLNTNQDTNKSPWFVGETVSIADCEVYHVVNNWIRPLPGGKEIIKKFPTIEEFRNSFEEQDEIQKFISSGKRPATTLPSFAGALNDPSHFD